MRPWRAETAVPVATGSVASAMTSTEGLSPRRTSRSKLAGISTANCTSPERTSRSSSSGSRTCTLEIEIIGVLHRRQHGAGQRPVVAGEHRRRQLLGVGVDGIAEQHELHDRHEDHGGEGHAVAPHLDEFLDDHRPHAPEEARIAALA